MKRLVLLLLLPALAGIPACERHPSDRPWLGAVELVAAPAGAGSRFPTLAGGGDTPVVMSWLQPGTGAEFALQFAQWTGPRPGTAGAWGPPRTVTAGVDWFVNWADFPSVVPTSARVWVAHWLQQRPGDVYAYDVRLAVSSDGGRNWSAPISPHDDGTPTEHGFVSLLRAGGDRSRAIWLDGRHTSGEHAHAAAAAPPGAMTLRTALLDAAGRRVGSDGELDGRVCDCCQTDAARSGDATVVVYRDRSDDEVRNIRALRIAADGSTTSVAVHDDAWRIAACPVNGPAIAAAGERVAVAWFTAPDRPRVRLAFSTDGGRSFAAPIEVASGPVAGRVDVELADDGRAVVSWLADGASGTALMAQPYTAAGAAGSAVAIARVGMSRASGFPQMMRAGPDLLFAWTETSDPPRVRVARASLL